MFTPPPSPLPALKTLLEDSETSQDTTPVKEPCLSTKMHPQEAKRRAGQRLRLAVLLVPLVVILFTAYETYLATHFADNSPSTPLQPLPLQFSFHGLKWKPHRRHPEPEPQAAGSSSSSTGTPPTSTLPSAPNQPLPTIPSSPPVLPTPFPQSLTAINQNFSSVSCSNFFANMTGSLPFRTCRPFSLLLSTSLDFINAQSNLTLMNNLIWGTCNTNTDYSQCQANMGWFSSALKLSCSEELNQNNALAATTLIGLDAFQVMHDTACNLSDPTTNSYCFINAVRNSNPSDLYYYQLPLGTGLPDKAIPSCSACSRSLMSTFSAALANPSMSPSLTGLKATYDNAAAKSIAQCGADFAKTNLVNSAAPLFGGSPVFLAGIFSFFMWVSLLEMS